MFFLLPKHKDKGQTYIDLIIAISIIAILSYALFTLVVISYQTISYTRTRTNAKHLAEQKIEVIRNLPYNDLGTVGGIPTGVLPQTETVIVNGLPFTVKTSVIYIDDPFDMQAPSDILPTDYKRARVDVSWGGIAKTTQENTVTLITDIAPKGIEKITGGGTLSILVFNSNAQPVYHAAVSIIADSTNPPINLNLETNENGRIMLPGAPICNSCYKLVVTKSGFSSDRTYSTAEVANPNKPDITILEGQLTEISFAIDQTSTLIVNTVGDAQINYPPIPNQSFYVTGGKTIGTDINDYPVYKYYQQFTTNSSGTVTINNLEWDNYSLNVTTGSSLDISGATPMLPLVVLANQNYSLTLSLSPHSNNSLLVSFVDSSQTPIAAVSAYLTDNEGYEATKTGGLAENPDFGQVFYPDLSIKNYYLTATASGYLDLSQTISVNGQSQERIMLTP